jgi:1,4-alpha-glucan branching enzyme
MPLEKQTSETHGRVVVTFQIPAEAGVTTVDVVGEFTDWGLVAMQSDENGNLSASFDLQVGRTYRFRYLLDGERWQNDWAADNYVPNDYGGDDSVVDLREFAR